MATTYAIFQHGDPIMVGHTPSGSAVTAGDVVVVGSSCRIAHRDIADGVLGALAIANGVYKLPKASTSSTAIAAGTVVYWDATNHVITSSSGSGANKRVGITTNTSVDADTTQNVFLSPG